MLPAVEYLADAAFSVSSARKPARRIPRCNLDDVLPLLNSLLAPLGLRRAVIAFS
jgi:hypothetical protein